MRSSTTKGQTCATVGLVLGSANGSTYAMSSEFCSFLRYGPAMRWTPEAIRQRRDDLGLTQQQLADRLGVVLRTVTAWETGESRPRRTAHLDEVLGKPPDSRAAQDLIDKGAAELVAEINERLTELARRVPPRESRRTYRHAKDAPDTVVPTFTDDDDWFNQREHRPDADTG